MPEWLRDSLLVTILAAVMLVGVALARYETSFFATHEWGDE